LTHRQGSKFRWGGQRKIRNLVFWYFHFAKLIAKTGRLPSAVGSVSARARGYVCTLAVQELPRALLHLLCHVRICAHRARLHLHPISPRPRVRTCFSHARARGTRPPHPAAWSQPVIEWWWMEVTYGLPRSTVASAASLDPSAKNLGTPAGRPRSDTADRTVCARGPRKLTNGGPERGR
jgi:hypothetical protein